MNTILRSALWGGGGMLAGAASATVAMLPFRPTDPVGFEDLGWALLTMAVAALLALVAGAAALHRTLRAEPHAGVTVLVFVPLALLLAAGSAGAGALLAPPLARWLVELVARRRTPAPVVGWGPLSRG